MSEIDSSLRFTPATLSWLQYITEQLLINVLKAAGQIVKDTTVGPRGGASRATLSYRDLAAVLDTLDVFSCVPVFDGCAELARDEGSKPDGDSGDDASKKGKAKAKGSGRGQAKAKAKAKGSGRGRATSGGSGAGRPKAKAKASPRGRGKSTGKGSGRGRGRSTAREPYHPMDKEKAKDKGLFAAKYSKDKSVA